MEREEKSKRITKQHFNETAKKYDEGYDGKYVKCMYDEVVERILALNPSSILDLGCGNGNVLSRLQEQTKAALYDLDLAENMIEEAKARLNEKVDLKVGDAEALPYEDNSFDVVVCNASFHHYVHPEEVLSEIRRVLSPKGVLILGDPTAPFEWYLKILNWALQWSNSGDYKIYSKKAIIELLEKNNFKTSKWKVVNYRNFVINAQKAE